MGTCCRERSMRLLPLLAVEARRLADVSRSPVDGNLWVGAQRSRAIDAAVDDVRGDDPIGRLSALGPLFERADHVEAIRPLATAAVPHAGRHEQAIGVRDPGPAANRLQYARVIVRAVERRDLRIAPALILNQLPASLDERRQVGIEGIDRAGISLFCASD